MAPQVEIRSELTYDALVDGWSLVRRVLAQPSTLQELAVAEGEDEAVVAKRLAPLVRGGVLRIEADRYHPVAANVHTTRLEGMVSGLSRYVLPLVTDLVQRPEHGFLVQLDLQLPATEQAGLRSGLVQQLLEELTSVSDEAAEEMRPYTAIIVGTSDVPPQAEAGDRCIETVRRCARQRSTPDAAARAVLTYYDALIGVANAGRAEEAVRRAAARMAERQVESGKKPNYTMVFAFGSRENAQGVGR